MRRYPKQKIILLLISFVTMISATLPSQSKFKNLQVLPKNITEKELDKIMDHFDLSLGVGCDYCHTKKTTVDELDFPSDNKPEKEIARKMITMTTAINDKYFNFTQSKTAIKAVTCFTCHKGEPKPVSDSIPPAPLKN